MRDADGEVRLPPPWKNVLIRIGTPSMPICSAGVDDDVALGDVRLREGADALAVGGWRRVILWDERIDGNGEEMAVRDPGVRRRSDDRPRFP
jgi:hypothetical protein